MKHAPITARAMTYAEAEYFNGEPVQHLVDWARHIAAERGRELTKRNRKCGS